MNQPRKDENSIRKTGPGGRPMNHNSHSGSPADRSSPYTGTSNGANQVREDRLWVTVRLVLFVSLFIKQYSYSIY